MGIPPGILIIILAWILPTNFVMEVSYYHTVTPMGAHHSCGFVFLR
ncbi:hypothetical protein DOT_4319 [Desulfosporosinus sp. OT]|nr:hypothetical protein DOT_4319 [Desulfosporosinus sp. OT]